MVRSRKIDHEKIIYLKIYSLYRCDLFKLAQQQWLGKYYNDVVYSECM